jgi:hypothetical protein
MVELASLQIVREMALSWIPPDHLGMVAEMERRFILER